MSIAAIVADKMTSEDIKEASILPSYLLESTETYNDIENNDKLTEYQATKNRHISRV